MNSIHFENITFGIELETIIPSGCDVTVGSYRTGCTIMNHDFNGKHWLAKSDSSIHDERGFYGCEFVSPVLNGEEGLKNLKEMVEWIKSIGGKVNGSCGCHVHIGFESVIGENPANEKLLNYLNNVIGVTNINTDGIYAQTGTRRDSSHYCRRLHKDIRETVEVAIKMNTQEPILNISRYNIVNLNNLQTKKTVEFRAFAGTLNIDKIFHHLWTSMWIMAYATEFKKARWEGSGWKSIEGGRGLKSLRGLHKKMGNSGLFGLLKTHKKAMKTKAREMAVKYDSISA